MAVAHVRNHAEVSVKAAGTNNLGISIQTATGAGNTLVARILFDNAAVASKPIVSSIAVAAGETASWVFLGAARSTNTTAGSFASGEMWAITTTVSWPVASYTVTLDTTTVMKGTQVQEFSGVLTTPRSTAGTAYSTTTTAASATTTGTTPVIGDLALGFIFGSNVAAAQAGDTDTTGGAWSSNGVWIGSTGGNAATNNFGICQYKILTAASHQTLNNSAVMTAGNGAIVAILQQYVPPSITQAAYQFFDDAGTESGAAALAAVNTPVTGDISNGDGIGALRIRLQNTTANPGNSLDDYQLQWKRGGDEYDITNATPSILSMFNTLTQVAQSFTANAGPLLNATFYMGKLGSPTGTVQAALWAHDGGSFGSTGLPTGAPLATSTTTLTASTVTGTTSAPQAVVFNFDGTFRLVAGTQYFIGLIATGAAASGNAVGPVTDSTSPTHPGNAAYFQAVWATTTSDVVFEVNTWTNVAYPPIDSYSGGSLTGVAVGSSLTQRAQSFIGNGSKLGAVRFELTKSIAAADGILDAVLYAHTGTFGSTGVPTGSPLAVSTTTIPGNDPSLTTKGWRTFVFDGTFTLTNGTPYFIGLRTTDTLAGYALLSRTNAGTHAGNCATLNPSWAAEAAADLWFELLAPAPGGVVVPYDNPNLTGGAVTTNRLGAGTGSFQAGEVCEDGNVNDIALNASAYTEILYSLKIIAADVVAGDTLRFRVLYNGATTQMTYTQTPTINVIRSAATVNATIADNWGSWDAQATGAVTTPSTNWPATINSNWGGEVSHAWFGADPADTFAQPPYELGTKFTVSTPTTCVGIRIRNPGTPWAGAADGRFAKLWDGVTQARLQTLNIVETMPSGWSEYLWDTPVALEVAHEYIVSYNVSTEGLCATTHLLDTPVTSGPVTLLIGPFNNTPELFPDTTYMNSYYGVDVLYSTGWAATATAVVTTPSTNWPATIATSWGTWTAAATGTITAPAPNWPATVASNWGTVTATATATVGRAATSSQSWGTWNATGTAIVTPNWPASVATNWGTWSATGVASIQRYGTIISSWGVWAASATGSISTPASWGIPQNVVATTTGQSTITVTWDAVPAATGYDVERNGTIIVFDHLTSPYNDTGLNSDTLYNYRVRAVG